ncbi:MAG: polymerase sigma-70 factor, subfamily, partial [Actinomycetota bacterium]|nr:polymerase sigma-70 factor, subfamily [Actinomycetota bacterium]
NVRQVVHRARSHVSARRPRFPTSDDEGKRVAFEFMQACASGETDRLLSLLAPDVTLWTDGGEHASAAKRPVQGSSLVTRFLLGVIRKTPVNDVSTRMASVNGEPGFIIFEGDTPTDVGALEIVEGKIRGIRIVRNPDKLRAVMRRRG